MESVLHCKSAFSLDNIVICASHQPSFDLCFAAASPKLRHARGKMRGISPAVRCYISVIEKDRALHLVSDDMSLS